MTGSEAQDDQPRLLNADQSRPFGPFLPEEVHEAEKYRHTNSALPFDRAPQASDNDTSRAVVGSRLDSIVEIEDEF